MNPTPPGILADPDRSALEEQPRIHLRAAGHETIDVGARFLDPEDDYPGVVVPLARAVAAGEIRRGVAICGSGIGWASVDVPRTARRVTSSNMHQGFADRVERFRADPEFNLRERQIAQPTG